MKSNIRIYKSTVGLGLIRNADGSRELVEFKSPRELQSRSFDEIFWLEEPSDELKVVAFYATFHKNNIY